MNKLTKLLSVFFIAGAIGTGIAGVAGCNKGGGSDSGDGGDGVTHTSEHRLNYTANSDGTTHKITCSVDGCDYVENDANHVYDGDADATCNLCNYERELGGSEVEYDLIPSSVDFKAAANELAGGETAANQTVGTDGYTYGGKFFFSSGARFEPGSSCVNTQKKDIKITVGGVTNSIKIVLMGASTSADTAASLKNASGTEVGAVTVANKVPGTIEVNELPAGTYTLQTNGGAGRVTELSIVEKLEKSEATGISVTASKVDFLINDDFAVSGLTVILNYKNGRKDTLSASDYEVTHSVDKTTAGKYTVTVKYKNNTQFTDTYDVYVYSIDSIEKHTIGYADKKQVTLQQAAVTGGTLSYDYLTVKGTGTVEGRTHTFNLPAAALNIENVSIATAGEKTVNVTVKTNYTTGGKTLACDYKVMVKDAVVAADNKVEITVGETGDFKTLTQAVQYLKECKLADSVNKVIKLQAGTYAEKVRIELPNVTLVGLGDAIDDTVLTCSLVEGDADPLNGSLWGLDCATLHVTGANFKAYNLAIRNDFDYINNAGNYSGSQSSQGLALTLDADGAVIYKCHLYGNQDTLFMKSGRSYYLESQIDGNVDFIFGNETGLAYFDNCTIKAICRTAEGKEQNGYVTAAKHVDASKPDYGYIFDSCHFTDDGKVLAGSMSLGRPWGAKATVAYINCDFSAAYSKLASDAAGKDHRWADMSGAKPENADFREFGSTGAGAISTAVKGGSIMDAATAANYTAENMFGTSNGKQAYTTVFKYAEQLTNLKILAGLESGEIPEDPTVSINLKDDTLPNGNCVAAINERYGEYLTWAGDGNIQNDKTNPNANKPENGVKVGLNTVITVNVVGEVSLVAGYALPTSDYLITYSEGKATIKFVAISGQYGDYIGSIVIDTSKTPEDTNTVNITVDYNDGTTANGTIVAAVGSPLAKPADPVRDGWKFVGWKVNDVDYTFTENVTEAFTLVAQWEEATDYNFTTGTTVVNFKEEYFGQSGANGNVVTWRGITIDGTGGKFVHSNNESNKYIQANANAKLKITVADSVTLTENTLSGMTLTIENYNATQNFVAGTDYTLSLDAETHELTITIVNNNTYIGIMTVAYSA